MAWIRSDCAILSDEWLLTDLDGWEFKAWTMFLHRVKAEGARGSVKATSTKILAAQWFIPEDSISSMIEKANRPNREGVARIREEGGRWYIGNWKKYQEDYKDADQGREGKGVSPEIPAHPPKRTTPQYITPQDNNPTPPVAVARTEAAAAAPVIRLEGNQETSGKPQWEMIIQQEWGIPFTKIPHKTLIEIVEMANKHGPERVLYAISEARKFDATNIAYVRGILEPKNRGDTFQQESNRAKEILRKQGRNV